MHGDTQRKIKKNLSKATLCISVRLSASLCPNPFYMNRYFLPFLLLTACQSGAQTTAVVQPIVITDTVRHDTDDPAIWINPADPAKSLIIGTDKDQDGGLYVFDLKGKIVREIHDLKRPNNVDIAYGLMLSGKPTDIAVTTERFTHKLRIFALPDMKPLDQWQPRYVCGRHWRGFPGFDGHCSL